jgi:hypothetical protein
VAPQAGGVAGDVEVAGDVAVAEATCVLDVFVVEEIPGADLISF